MLFCIKTEISDLYFDWLSFLETCQTTLEWILGFLTEQGWVLNDDAPLAAAKILDEGSIVEKLAEEAKEDVHTSLQRRAQGLAGAWAIIKKHCRKPMKTFFSEGDERYNKIKARAGDQELFRVMSREFGSCQYRFLRQPLAEKLYKNCSAEDVGRSAVLRMNAAPVRSKP
ncbi:hypothetical protein NKR23_g50 [Pleurostoma richardsiae]|uniref:Uncharacterized protein n=1 Tax=Pleurostoma richardsiae TaxID=41990 RepID=A0AA38RW48_9PEZI|nr:hypothetical protein NKR23_g50 [Pleurostoma richardsiae]